MTCNLDIPKITVCTPITQEEAECVVSDLLPFGIAWDSKNEEDSISKAVTDSFASTYKDLVNTLMLVCEEFDPAHTTLLIERFERMLGLPDDCFKTLPDTIEGRRKLVVIKLACMNVANEQDYIDLAAALGFDITITYPETTPDTFPYTFPYTFGLDEEALFSVNIIINFNEFLLSFPYEFPYLFGESEEVSQLICLFNTLKPVHIKFNYSFNAPTPPEPPETFFILTEDGNRLITEDGNNLITEAG